MEQSKSMKELIRSIKELTYQWQFNRIIKLLNDNVPEFFAVNGNVLYIIMKFMLIDKLRSGAQSDAQEFYNDYLIQILKKTHPNRYEEKNSFFLALINNPNLCADNCNIALRYIVDLKQQANFERFHALIEKLLLNGKANDQYGDSQVDYFSDYEKEYSSFNNSYDLSFIHTVNPSFSSSSSSTVRPPCSSTMPLFNVTIDNAMTAKTITAPHNPNPSKSLAKLFVVNSGDSPIKVKPAKYSSSKSYSNDAENVQSKHSKSHLASTCSEQYFNPKYSRRVNICKKICRKFRKYLKERSDLQFSPFWLQFVKDYLLPPFQFEEEKVEFKSFSNNYLKWLFNHEGSSELYQCFINDRADRELKAIYDEYQIDNIEERRTLEKYFKEFCTMFNEKKGTNYDNLQSQLENLHMIDKEEEKIVPKDELFDGLIKELCFDEKNKRRRRTQFERSRETECNVFDPFISSRSSSSFSSDKEE